MTETLKLQPSQSSWLENYKKEFLEIWESLQVYESGSITLLFTDLLSEIERAEVTGREKIAATDFLIDNITAAIEMARKQEDSSLKQNLLTLNNRASIIRAAAQAQQERELQGRVVKGGIVR